MIVSLRFSAGLRLRLAGLALLLALTGCQSTPTAPDGTADLTQATDSLARADAQRLKALLNTLPAPRQAIELLQAAGARYAAELPNPTTSVNRYQTSVKSALNLGVYSADLAYAGAYRQNQVALDYYNTAQTLADQLGIGGAFDPEVFQQLERNRDNADSTAAIIARAFERVDRNLRATNQGDIARLIVVGGWVEGLYLSCELHARRPNPELALRIAEQKILLEELTRLLQAEPLGADFAPYQPGLDQILAAYQPITITYTPGEAKEDAQQKVIRIGNENQVAFTPADLAAIRAAVTALRTQIVQ